MSQYFHNQALEYVARLFDKAHPDDVASADIRALMTGPADVDNVDLIEQLRHACSVGLGDLLAQGMPPQTSTGKCLLAAIVAAERHLAEVKKEA